MYSREGISTNQSHSPLHFNVGVRDSSGQHAQNPLSPALRLDQSNGLQQAEKMLTDEVPQESDILDHDTAL